MPVGHTAVPISQEPVGSHARHVSYEEAPTVVEYVPPQHSVHAALPSLSLNVPATHATHATPFSALCPIGHGHVHAVLPASELFPVGHAVHSPTPLSAPYQPSAHNLWHAAADELPGGEVGVVVEHDAHALPPVVVRYFPAAQSVHPIVPRVALYFPAAHAGHPVHKLSAPVYPALLQPYPQTDSPAAHVVPVAHVRHTVAPVVGAYVPAAHDAQVVPPAAHGPHCVPTAENVPAAHAVHVASQLALPSTHVVCGATHDRHVVLA